MLGASMMLLRFYENLMSWKKKRWHLLCCPMDTISSRCGNAHGKQRQPKDVFADCMEYVNRAWPWRNKAAFRSRSETGRLRFQCQVLSINQSQPLGAR